MPTRREAMHGMLVLSMSPFFILGVNKMENKLLPMLPHQNKLDLNTKHYKEFLILAMHQLEDFIDLHKIEIIQYGLLIIALSLILATGIPPTKELIMFLL
jgi:hypothetical protein